MGDKMKRVFLGVPLNKEYGDACEQVKSMNHDVQGIRWVPEQNLHVTTLFIGNVEQKQIDTWCDDIEIILKQHRPFELAFDRFVFMPPRRPRMIWLKFKRSSDFARLTLALSHKLLDQDPDSPPKAHVTLARFKEAPEQKLIFPEMNLETIPVNKIQLYQSVLTPQGATYSVLKSFDL
ncbi:MAG: RNA 2',3'-cyclic phosphodiesterase [Candidatus Delongbacteria bacterium]|jgi:2'-5' RNA ligase|nr:RNA 2',3'-cyclic phosphodiesterase [Candidatus Delongbacteria bacterium]